MVIRKSGEKHWQAFFLAFGLALLIFIPFLIFDRGVFFYYGDYNVQQIPFYRLAHDAVRNGEIFWNWNTDLGVNFIGSYSFYLLGSPFFYLTLLFPSSWVVYLMAPLLCLKIAVAALTSYLFIRRFVRRPEYALIGALLYAFSGFSIYNIFFNHFHEAIAFFPLLLIGLEELVQNNRKGVFAAAVGINCFVNYFFFFGDVVFVVIYFMVRCLSKDFRITWRKFLLLALESVLGVGMSLILLLPSVFALLQNPRLERMLTGWDFLLYNNVQRYPLIFESFFFPADIPARPNFFPDSNAKWSSIAGWLPLVSMSGVIVFLRDRKRHWARRLIIISIIMAMVPGLNSAFTGFNDAYYGRWFYMPILIMCVATAMSFDSEKADFKYGLKWCAVFVVSFSIIGIFPKKVDDELKFFQLPSNPALFWVFVIIAAGSLMLMAYLVINYRKSKRFARYTTVAICCVTVVYSIVSLAAGRANGNYTHELMDMGIHGGEKFDLPEDENFYRIDVYKGVDNYAMFWGMPTIQAFHSIVPGSVLEFYSAIGVERGVASRPELRFYALRGLTSVKYLMFPQNETMNKDVSDPELPGFEYIGYQNECKVYENKYFVPMGYTYDHYVDELTFESTVTDTRDRLLMQGVYLSDEQIQRYSDILTPLPERYSDKSQEELYLQDCLDRASDAAYSFVTDRRGFTAKSNLSRENLMVFSVPYDEGWSATVNGEPVDIEKVNVGFMAVRVPEGEAEIRFVYNTPGLVLGAILTLVFIGLFVLYLLVSRFLAKKNPEKYASRPNSHFNDQENLERIAVQDAYIRGALPTPEDGSPPDDDSAGL